MRHRAFAVVWTIALMRVATAQDAAALSPDTARAYFAEADQLCTADGAGLWETYLCGPMMFIDEKTRTVVANQPDKQGLLHADRGLFVGTWPMDRLVFDGVEYWGGMSWSALPWPLDSDRAQRAIELMRGSFRLLEPSLHIPARFDAADFDYLDTLDGRYLLQLEWRAVSLALHSSDDNVARSAARDALEFRFARYWRFLQAEMGEPAAEYYEGLAEYTGVYLAGANPAERIALATTDIDERKSDMSYIRTFAEASGPAYGLLLDRFAPQWRRRVPNGNLGELLSEALGPEVALLPRETVEQRAARYDGESLRAREITRQERKRAEAGQYRARFIDGPRLVLSSNVMAFVFWSPKLEPLEDEGIVYQMLKGSAAWGVLTVTGGALVNEDRNAVVVPASKLAQPTQDGLVEGVGWTLKLNPGWRLVPGQRAGDWTVARDR